MKNSKEYLTLRTFCMMFASDEVVEFELKKTKKEYKKKKQERMFAA